MSIVCWVANYGLLQRKMDCLPVGNSSANECYTICMLQLDSVMDQTLGAKGLMEAFPCQVLDNLSRN